MRKCCGCEVKLEVFFPNPNEVTISENVQGQPIKMPIVFSTGNKNWVILRCPKCGMLYAEEDNRKRGE